MARMKMKRVFETTMQEVFHEFIIDKTAEGTSDKTLKTYASHFHSIGKWLNTQMPIAELTDNHLKQMIAEMRNSTLSASSIASYVRSLKSFLSWCNANDKTQVNIKLYKAPETVKDTYTDKELKALLQKPNIKTCGFTEYRNWVTINLLLNCGCRAKTVRTFLIKDVNLDNQTITYRHTKNGKIQIVPLCSAMIPIMREYLRIRDGESNDVLFPNENGKPLTESGLRQGIETYNLSRGVNKTSIHLFRHTFAERYLKNGGNSLYLQKVLGHSTLAMTKHYCNIYDVDLVKTFDTYSPLATLK
jgi:integrase/recombinase XerD